MRIAEQGENVNAAFFGEMKKNGGHRFSALPKASYRINWILDGSGIIRYSASISAKPLEAYQLKERGASSENLKGTLCQEFMLSGNSASVRIRQKGNSQTVSLKGNADAGLFRSTELPEELEFYREDGKMNFRIQNLRAHPEASLEIHRKKGAVYLRIVLLKAEGRKTEQKAEFSCEFILQ